MPSRKNPYRHNGVKTTVYGHKKVGHEQDGHCYDSKLEGQMARLLIKHGIGFTPHVKFALVRPDGTPFHYTIDFLLTEPVGFVGISGYINAIEVKGVLTRKDLKRLDAFEYCTGYKGFIVGRMLIDFWEREGIKK